MKTIEKIVKHYITSLIGLFLVGMSSFKIIVYMDTIGWERLTIYAAIGVVGLTLFVSTDTWIKDKVQKLTDKITSKVK